MITGKCKEDFDAWLEKEADVIRVFNENGGELYFEDFNFSMQYGVYVDFFDSVGIKIIIGTGFSGYLFNYRLSITGLNDEFDNEIESRSEARQKAIEKACEIYNEQK